MNDEKFLEDIKAITYTELMSQELERTKFQLAKYESEIPQDNTQSNVVFDRLNQLTNWEVEKSKMRAEVGAKYIAELNSLKTTNTRLLSIIKKLRLTIKKLVRTDIIA